MGARRVAPFPRAGARAAVGAHGREALSLRLCPRAAKARLPRQRARAHGLRASGALRQGVRAL